MLDHNYDVRHTGYNIDMKKMFQKTPTIKLKPLIKGQKFQKLMTEIGGGWYMEKLTKGLPLLRRPKLSKNHKIKTTKFKNSIKLISGGMIGNSNYIGTSLSGSIQEVKSKEKNPTKFLQRKFLLINILEPLIGLAIQN